MSNPQPPTLEYDPDESRPAKRVRLDAALDVTEDLQEEIVDDDDWGDIYGTEEPEPGAAAEASATENVLESASTLPGAKDDVLDAEEPEVDDAPDADAQTSPSVAVEPPDVGTLPLAPPGERAPSEPADPKPQNTELGEVDDGIPAEAIDDGEDLIVEQHAAPPPAADEASMRMVEEMSGINGDEEGRIAGLDGQTNGVGEVAQVGATGVSAGDVGMRANEGEGAGVEAETAAEPATEVVKGDTHEPTTAEPTEETGTDLLSILEQPTSPTADARDAQPAPPPKPTDDAEFMAAAAAQKKDANSEWQFDSSDAASSSASSSDSDSDSDDTSDSDSDGGYELLDAATAAKILMSGDGDDDDSNNNKKAGKSGDQADNQPRTANEVKETVVPKPDVTITPDMPITLLGHVEMSVENTVLIKGCTPGEYQVLESGSVLCNASREVIGVVAETIGKVTQPMYSVNFTNAEGIEAVGLKEHGSKVFYVDQHSTFVFTQPLRNLRGTDASNIHDEEVAEEEMEFSDDEAEAEFKRAKKMAKKAGRGGVDGAASGSSRGGRGGRPAQPGHGFGAPGNAGYAGDAPPAGQTTYGGGGLSYDDEEPGVGGAGGEEEFYSPLRRPENLSQMMAAGGPPKAQHLGDRGRGGRGRGGDRGGRGDRGRGRGDRGRGRGQDREQRGGGRGGRGGFNQDRGGARGSGRGGQQANGRQHSLPPKPPQAAGQASSPPPPQAAPAQQQYAQAAYGQPQQQYPGAPALQPQPQARQAAGGAQTYQFGGYTFQYGQQAPTQQGGNYGQQQQQQQQQQSPPAGAYVNPAFYSNQQQHQPHQQHQQQAQTQWTPQQQAYAQTAQWQQPQQQQGYGQQWNGQQHQQQAYTHPGVGQPSYTPTQQQQQNLAEILRRMGGGG